MPDTVIRGLEFLLREQAAAATFTPEDFSSEQRQIAATTEAFVQGEVLPALADMESQDFALVVAKMRQCAELGLFLADIPESFGGLELDKASSMLLAEKMAPAGSFAVTYAGQTGIATLPLVYYGTTEQKQRYLEKLTNGEWIGAYCLTEPECGSDPLSARTTAILSADGRHYRLNGVKQFITNAAFADLFTVFAKIDGEHFSAFLVERTFPGLRVGPEERKMGYKGSSTAQVLLDDVPVPAENLLGKPGQGHKIAFNVLNIGRLKLAATVTGTAKSALAMAAAYAGERRQFGRPIAAFGAIREKLADMAAATFAAESLVYRVAGLLDGRIGRLERTGTDYYERYQKAIEEFAAECAIAKVFCSETLAGVVDQVVQVHGGYGFIGDYPAERYYRDERINRIFEGTNEINRLLIPTLLLRRAAGGRLALQEGIDRARARLAAAAGRIEGNGPFGAENRLLAELKQCVLALFGAVGAAREAQEVQLTLADMIIAVFALESVVLRAAKGFPAAGDVRRKLLQAAVRTVAFAQVQHFQQAAWRCCAYTLTGDRLNGCRQAIFRLTAWPGEGLLAAC